MLWGEERYKKSHQVVPRTEATQPTPFPFRQKSCINSVVRKNSGARSIRPQFPEIFSSKSNGTLFLPIRFENFGQPLEGLLFSGNVSGNSEISCSIWHFYPVWGGLSSCCREFCRDQSYKMAENRRYSGCKTICHSSSLYLIAYPLQKRLPHFFLKKKGSRPRQDSNLESPDSWSDALSIGPRGQSEVKGNTLHSNKISPVKIHLTVLWNVAKCYW